jgi:hypothetical protein
MTTFDPIPGKALLVVIAQSENLSTELKAKIHRLSTPWKTHQPDVNDQIRNLISQDRHLQKLYQDAYDTLEGQYQNQQRAKTLDVSFPPEEDLWDTVSQVLSDPDPFKTARRVVHIRQAQSLNTAQSRFWEKSDRIAVMLAGGAFLGGVIAQIPGAISGAAIAALYGWYIGFGKSEPTKTHQ